MSTYYKHWEQMTTDTTVSSCSAARTALISANMTDDVEAKKRFLLHSLDKLNITRARITQDLIDLL